MGGAEFYDCAVCAAQPVFKEQLGHDGPPTGWWEANLLTGAPLARCPLRDFLDAQADDPARAEEFLRMRDEYLPLYEDGHLLVDGGVSDQPARYLDWMRALRKAAVASEVRFTQLTRATPREDGE